MKTQIKKLNRISKIECLNPANYYCISLTESNIQLQGHFNGKLSLGLAKLFGNGSVDNCNGYVVFSKHNIEITLTE